MDCRGDTTSACTNGDPITWYSFNKPKQINLGTQYAQFVYGPNRQRIKQINSIGTSSPDRQIHYVGRYFEWEKNKNGSIKKHRFRSTVFAYGKAVYWIKDTINDDGCNTNPGTETYFILRDHLGSVDVLASYVGGSDRQYSYDAFGKRRNQTGWTADTNDSLLASPDQHTIKRGYTGHEHLDNVKLIHMNGRVQDPIVGRMLSRDPLQGDLRDPQSLNPYSYVQNRPLSATDPSGFNTIYEHWDPGITDFGDFILDLELSISNYQHAFRGWAACARATRSDCGGPPSVAGIVGAANAVIRSSTARAFADNRKAMGYMELKRQQWQEADDWAAAQFREMKERAQATLARDEGSTDSRDGLRDATASASGGGVLDILV